MCSRGERHKLTDAHIARGNHSAAVLIAEALSACNGFHLRRAAAFHPLPLTHEFLSLMLGVRRAGVTEAVQSLRKKNLIQAGRGMIEVLGRNGIERIAGGFYGVPEQEYQRLLG
jgi:CRP-like cAMP-binding protein